MAEPAPPPGPVLVADGRSANPAATRLALQPRGPVAGPGPAAPRCGTDRRRPRRPPPPPAPGRDGVSLQPRLAAEQRRIARGSGLAGAVRAGPDSRCRAHRLADPAQR